MGQVTSRNELFGCFQNRKREKKLLNFFNTASEDQLVSHFPFLQKSVAQSIIEQRSSDHLIDVYKCKWLKKSILAKFQDADNLSIESITLITERLPSVPSCPTGDALCLPICSTDCELEKFLSQFCIVKRTNDFHNPPSTIRISSWNLDRFTLAKAKNPHFRETICLTILSHNIDVIAFQEVFNQAAIDEIANELNFPTLQTIVKWYTLFPSAAHWTAITSAAATGPSFQGSAFSSFLFRSNRVQVVSSGILGKVSSPKKQLVNAKTGFTRAPYMIKLNFENELLILASVHLKATEFQATESDRTGSEAANLATFVDALTDTFGKSSRFVILGDFNMDPSNSAFTELRARGLVNVIPSTYATMLAAIERNSIPEIGEARNRQSTASCFDNAWLSQNLSSRAAQSPGLQFFKIAYVITDNLRHPCISSFDRASLNGPVSDHCPILFELSYSQ